MRIQPILPENLAPVKSYANAKIGLNYYSEAFYEMISRGKFAGCSFALLDDDDKIRGIRFTLGPGDWMEPFRTLKLHCRDQGLAVNTMAYFKTIYIDKELTGQGWGGKLSTESMAALKSLGVSGIICHSVSSHSAHNSSARYLKKLGFVALGESPKYWEHLTEVYCHICASGPCQCDAVEMFCDLTKPKNRPDKKVGSHEE